METMATMTRVTVYGERPLRFHRVVFASDKAPRMTPLKPSPCSNNRGPPKRLLAPLPLSDSVSAYNSNDSSFLHKLPPEIRMQIYQYALGGNTIFFHPHHSTCTDKCHRNRYRCRAHVADDPTGEPSNPSGSDYDYEQAKQTKRRPKRDWEPSGNVDLELLLTCRQIYNETVLVPFAAKEFGHNSNSFTSDDRPRINFLRALIPDQSRAISTLHIRGVVKNELVQQQWQQQQISAMSGLRRLKLSFDWKVMAVGHSSERLMAALEDRFEASGVSIFAMAKLQIVEITIALTVHFRVVKAVMAREDELVA